MSHPVPLHAHASSWPVTGAMPVLQPDEVHVWHASITAWTPHRERLASLLDQEELGRSARFHFDRDRNQLIAAHALLRALLGGYVGCAPAAVGFETGPAGKPYAASPPAAAALEFNLSHSADLVMIAMCRGCAVGVDVERWSDDVDPLELAPHSFSNAEQAELAALTPDQQRAAFFTCWSRKEAWIKASGLGVSRGLDYFDMVVAADRRGRILADRLDPARAERCQVVDLDAGAGYSAALVVGEQGRRIRRFTLDPNLGSTESGVAM